jgi:hypothetical protein
MSLQFFCAFLAQQRRVSTAAGSSIRRGLAALSFFAARKFNTQQANPEKNPRGLNPATSQ